VQTNPRTTAFHAHDALGKWPTQPRLLAQVALARLGEVLKSGDHDVVYLIDGADCRATRELCEEIGYEVETFADVPSFLADHRPTARRCLLIDMTRLDGRGFDCLERLRDDDSLPCIVMSDAATYPMAVQAIRAGAFDFIEKPISRELFAASLERALNQADRMSNTSTIRKTAAARIATLTRRQHQIMDLVIAGHPSKNIAADLGISQRTVENHRASICRKTGSRNLSALIHTAIYGAAAA
jgi:two-component system, chemotaxis family, CheB/CheR fusion protein